MILCRVFEYSNIEILSIVRINNIVSYSNFSYIRDYLKY